MLCSVSTDLGPTAGRSCFFLCTTLAEFIFRGCRTSLVLLLWSFTTVGICNTTSHTATCWSFSSTSRTLLKCRENTSKKKKVSWKDKSQNMSEHDFVIVSFFKMTRQWLVIVLTIKVHEDICSRYYKHKLVWYTFFQYFSESLLWLKLYIHIFKPL